MPHGTPDWYGLERYGPGFLLMDLAEVAARVGKTVLYDRRGNVLLVEEFEHGATGWSMFGAGVWPEAGIAQSGGISIRLASVLPFDWLAAIYRDMWYPTLPGIGLEASLADLGFVQYLYLSLDFEHPDGNVSFSLVYSFVDETVSIVDATGALQVIAASYGYGLGEQNWCYMKVVVNPVRKRYVRGIINGIEYDLSAYAGYPAAGSPVPLLRVSLTHDSLGVFDATPAVDTVIVTQEEPM